jgi:hypothetical protein
MFCYGLARWQVARRYGMGAFCESDAGAAKYALFVLAGGALLLVAWLGRAGLDDVRMGFLCGAGTGLMALGAAFFVVQRRRRARGGE